MGVRKPSNTASRTTCRILILAALAVLTWYGSVLARYYWLENQFLHGDDSEALAAAKSLAGTCDGIQALAVALASEEVLLVERSSEAIMHAMDSWALEDETAAATKLDTLAFHLAKHVENMPATGREAAVRIALRLLTWQATNSGSVQQRVAHSEWVLAIATSDAGDHKNAKSAIANESAPQPHSLAFNIVAKASELPPIELSAMPGGGLPLPQIELASVNDIALHTTVAGPDSAPHRSMPVEQLNEPRAITPPEEAKPLQALTASTAPELRSADNRPLIPAANQTAAAKQVVREIPAVVPPQLRLCLLDLAANDPALVSSAEQELILAGLSTAEIEVASRFMHADPAERRKLAESLPGFAGVDARLWLIWLSHDSSAEVRSAAVAIMATTGEPSMIARVEQVAREDADGQVQQVAARSLGKLAR